MTEKALSEIEFYQVPDELAELDKKIEESINPETGEFEGDTAALAKQFHLERKARDGILWYARKNENITANICNLERDIKALTEKMDELVRPYLEKLSQLEKIKEAREKRREWNKQLILELLHAIGADRIEDNYGRAIYIRRTRSVSDPPKDFDFDCLDPKFVKIKKSLNKKAILDAFKAGEWMDGRIEIKTNETVIMPREVKP